jgi:hypothetical protein
MTMVTQGFQGYYAETRSYDATAAFWRSLGFENVFETGHGSGQWRHPSGGPYVFVNEQHDTELEDHPILSVADAAAFDPLRPLDVAKPFTAEHWGVAEALIRDPDGRVISLQAPLQPGVEEPDAAVEDEPTTPEFGGHLAGAVFWGADLTGATFRDVDLTGTSISHARLVDVEIDASIGRLVVNGVDVTDYVNERDPWFPLRSMIEPTEPAGVRVAWSALEQAWSDTISIASGYPDADLHLSVDGEWSFVDTLRHLVFAIDKWYTVPVAGGSFHPLGLPNSGSIDFPWPGIDRGLQPSVADALAAYRGRVEAVRANVESVTIGDLGRRVDVLENGEHSVQDCLWTIFEELFWHNRYARRDLERLTPAG